MILKTTVLPFKLYPTLTGNRTLIYIVKGYRPNLLDDKRILGTGIEPVTYDLKGHRSTY